MIGPPIEYRKFQKYIEKEEPFKAIPSPKQAMLENLKEFMACSCIFAISEFVVPPSHMKTSDFFSNSSGYVAVYAILSITALRFKYYSAWKLSMFVVHASGISYIEEKKNFHGVNHCNVRIIETSPHIREKIGNWNMTVH